ncbi:MAG TPA: DUF1961 family protein [Firmicutes bacterium]|jgi:hypothetical protein|nr:DUF1961 family protein [Bacillota bacterium]
MNVSERSLQLDAFRVEDWVPEGPAVLSIGNDGRLVIDSLEGGSTIWYKPQTFTGDINITWETMAVEPMGKNNLNFIFHAVNADDSDVLTNTTERTGHYPEYHRFPNYIVTFVGPAPDEGYTRLRRNPGFELVSDNTGIRAELGKRYEINIGCRSGRITVNINGKTVHDYVDPKPLTAGRLGIRTWQTKLEVYKLKVSM